MTAPKYVGTRIYYTADVYTPDPPCDTPEECTCTQYDLTPVPGATPLYDDDGREVVDVVTCGTCGRSWNDAAPSDVTPTPAGRCPFEYEHEDTDGYTDDPAVRSRPREHGHGETVESGWVDPRWSRTTVYENREDVRPDYPFGTVWDFDEEAVAAAIVADVLLDHAPMPVGTVPHTDYLEDYISDRIGAIDSFDGATAYAADPDEDYRTGVRAMLAAHVSYPGEEEAIREHLAALFPPYTPGED